MRLAFAIILLLLTYSPAANAAKNDYIYPFADPSFSNYGTIGLMQLPTARMHSGGTIAFNWVDNDPYQRGSIIAYPFDWFEASYQYTDINNALYSNVPQFSGDQTYKDKSFDGKIRLFKEKMLIPEISVGARDLGGT